MFFLGKVLPVYHPLKKKAPKKVNELYLDQQYAKLDPEGWRRALITQGSPTRLLPGDVVRIVYKTRQMAPFMGQIIGISKGGVSASLLLRNNITKLGVELRVKIFSPLIQRVDVVKKPFKRRLRNKHYYIRGTRLDVGDLEADLKKTRRKMRR